MGGRKPSLWLEDVPRPQKASKRAPSTQVLSPTAPKENFRKGRKKILGRYFIRSAHLLPLGFLASRVPQVWENGNEEGNQLGVRNEFDLVSRWLKGEETPRIPALSRK